jgi:hypothetical protein
MWEREGHESGQGGDQDDAHTEPERATKNPEAGHPVPGEGVGLPEQGPGRPRVNASHRHGGPGRPRGGLSSPRMLPVSARSSRRRNRSDGSAARGRRLSRGR